MKRPSVRNIARALAETRVNSTAHWRARQWGVAPPGKSRVKRSPEVKKALDVQVRAVLSTLSPSGRKELLRRYHDSVKWYLARLEKLQLSYQKYAPVIADPSSPAHKREYYSFKKELTKKLGPHVAGQVMDALIEAKKVVPPKSRKPCGIFFKSETDALSELQKRKGLIIHIFGNRGVRNPEKIVEEILPELVNRTMEFNPKGGLPLQKFIVESALFALRENKRQSKGRGEVRRRTRSLDELRGGRLFKEPADYSHEAAQSHSESEEVLYSALSRLSPQQQRLIAYRYLDGLPMEEVARRLRVGLSRAEKVHLLAQNRLRKLLEKYYK